MADRRVTSLDEYRKRKRAADGELMSMYLVEEEDLDDHLAVHVDDDGLMRIAISVPSRLKVEGVLLNPIDAVGLAHRILRLSADILDGSYNEPG